MKKIFLIAAIIFFMVFYSFPAKAENEPLILGIQPYLASSLIHKRFTPLAEYLSKKVGQPVIIKVPQDYRDHIENVGKNKVHIALMGPVPYIKMVKEYDLKPILACLETNKKTFFQGVIITRKNSPIKSLSDIEGKRFAFGDPNSTMSHIIPRFLLLEAGIPIKKLGSHSFLKNHCNVALGVLIGDYDAGAVKEEVFDRYKERGLKAIARTPFTQEHIFVAGNNLSAKTVQTLREALYNLKNETNGKEILSAIKQSLTGLAPCKDDSYKNLRKIMRSLEEKGVKL